MAGRHQGSSSKALMTKSDIYRALLHFPVGLLACDFTFQAPVPGAIFSIGFLTYEVIEDWRIKDRSYKDIWGYLVGYALVGILRLYIMPFWAFF